jgi:hypothetical protein
MVRRLALACCATLLLAAAVVPIRAAAAVGIVETKTALSPSPNLFGEELAAELVILVNTKVADPASFETRARFLPYTLVVPPRREERRDGNVVRIRYRYRLACDALQCTTGAKRERTIEFPAVRIRYRDDKEHSRTVNAAWPDLRLVSRVGDSQFRPQSATEAERGLPTAPILELAADVSAPTPTYRFAPTTGALVAFVAALLALAGAAWLAAPVVALARSETAEPELSPLDRALASVDTSVRQEPGSAEHREALALLARELRRAGLMELVQPARRLAWSEGAPTARDTRELVQQVRAGRARS